MVAPTSEISVILRGGDHADTERLFEDDPEKRQVLVYSEAPETATVLDNPEVVHGTGPVAGFRLQMADIWAGLNS